MAEIINSSSIHLAIFGLSIFILGYWLRFVYLALAFDRLIQKLSKFSPLPSSPPKITIVVPARNEGKNIEACLIALQRQTYPDLEVILVNDRSEDETGSVMQKYAAMKPQWHFIHIESLPEGWIGKNHALQVGGEKATGDYIIFTDGDVIYQPSTVEKTMGSVLAHDLDHLVLSATLKGDGPMLIAMQALFTQGMVNLLQLHKLGKSPDYYIGAGVYNLVKTSLYRDIGGHKTIALEIIDDLMLGKIMVQAGGKPGFMDGRELISVEWYPSAWQMVLGLEKNGFASARYSLLKLLPLLFVMYVIYLFPYAGVLMFPGPLAVIFGICLVFAHATMAEVSRRTGHSVWVTILLPFASLLIGFAFLRSAFLTLKRGKVTWRDTSYSLDLLRRSTKL